MAGVVWLGHVQYGFTKDTNLNTADYAILVSLASIVIAFAALFWNVIEKFIFVRPELHVAFGLYKVMLPAAAGNASRSDQQLLTLSVTNMGPGPVVIYMCVGKGRCGKSLRTEVGMINPIHGDPTHDKPSSLGPFSAGLPLKLEPGELKAFYFPYKKDVFLGDGLSRVGVADTYNREKWCSSRDMKKVMVEYRKDFENKVDAPIE